MQDTLPPPAPGTTNTSLPPPPPPLDPRPNRAQTQLLVGLLVAGVVLALISLLEFPHHDLLQRAGFFLGTYALLVATSWLPASVLTARVDRLVEKWVRNTSGGYYGVMALSVFAQLELASMLDAIASFELSTGSLVSMLIKHVIGFSTESIMNLVYGMAWPGKLIPQHGSWPTGILVAATWLVFRAGRDVLPHSGFAKKKTEAPATA